MQTNADRVATKATMIVNKAFVGTIIVLFCTAIGFIVGLFGR